jgi:DNA primase
MDHRRVDAESVLRYGVRWDEHKKAWILPLREHRNHRLLGYQVKGERSRYFRNQPREVPKSSTLFGIDVVEKEPKVIVVESPLDAVLLYRLGYAAVAVCGSRLSDDQLNILRGFDVVFALDNDTAGKREHARLKRLIKAGFVQYTGPWKDVGEMRDADIRRAVDRR